MTRAYRDMTLEERAIARRRRKAAAAKAVATRKANGGALPPDRGPQGGAPWPFGVCFENEPGLAQVGRPGHLKT